MKQRVGSVLVLIMAGCLLLSGRHGGVLGAPNPEEPAPPQQPQPIPELVKTAQTMLADLWTSIKNTYGIDADYMAKTFRNQSAAFVEQMQKNMAQLGNQIKEKTPELEKQWAEVQGNLKKIVDDVNANVPNAKESLEQMQKQFQEGVQAVVRESSAVSEKFKANGGQIQEEIATFTKEAINAAVEVTKGLNEQLKNFASQPAEPKSSS